MARALRHVSHLNGYNDSATNHNFFFGPKPFVHFYSGVFAPCMNSSVPSVGRDVCVIDHLDDFMEPKQPNITVKDTQHRLPSDQVTNSH